jgi:hypothetical protein
MLGKPSRRLRKHLEKKGRIATAAVVEISGWGPTVGSGGGDAGPIRDAELVLKATLRIAPDDQQPFEVTDKFRFPKGGEPSQGDEIGVIYDPDDHDKVMLEPPDLSEAAVGIKGDGIGSGRKLDKNQREDMMQEAQGWLEAFGEGSAGPRADPIDQVARLAEQKEKGEISAAEFEAQKAKLLGGD